MKYILCKILGHRLKIVEMTEEACKIAFIKRDFRDLYECLRCHGRTSKY